MIIFALQLIQGMTKLSVQDIRIEEYNYALPDDRIARYPLPDRNLSKLLVFDGTEIITDRFNAIANHIAPGSLMVFNNTRVIQARLYFEKPTGARVEIFCLHPVQPAEYADMFSSTGSVVWECLVGNSKRWNGGRLNLLIPFANGVIRLEAERLSSQNGKSMVQFAWDDPSVSFGRILDLAGQLPIPPYLGRNTELVDNTRYQTIYSAHPGSVAAPTAGLHFSDSEMEQLKHKAIACEYLTLHVGAGTFQPVKSPTIGEHAMHTEVFTANRELIHRLAACEGPLIAVGTTTLRALESLYWLACLPDHHEHTLPCVGQWDAYHCTPLSRKDAMNKLLHRLQGHNKTSITAATSILIAPGYKFGMIDALVTNFHQPASTLLMLVSALVGDRWKEIYNYALTNNYRFLSYGDSSLLWPAANTNPNNN